MRSVHPSYPTDTTVFVAAPAMPSTDADPPRDAASPPSTGSSTAADVRADVAYLEEYTWRWKNHLQMLETVAQSNIDPETVQRWRHQIHACFREKLAAKL